MLLVSKTNMVIPLKPILRLQNGQKINQWVTSRWVHLRFGHNNQVGRFRTRPVKFGPKRDADAGFSGWRLCVTLHSTPTSTPLGTILLCKLRCTMSSVQPIWYWHRWPCIARTLNPSPKTCLCVTPKTAPYASGWDTRGRDKSSISDKLGENGLSPYNTFQSSAMLTNFSAEVFNLT